MNNKLIAEGFGTFILALAVLASVHTADAFITTPVIAGLVVVLFVYTIGAKSGAHLNPGVTAGIWSLGKMKSVEALWYMVAQFIGGALAMLVASYFFSSIGWSTTPESLSNFLAELIGMAIFTFGIASVVYGKIADNTSGIVIGGSLLLGIIIAVYFGSLGALNPVIALTLGAFNFSYILSAIFGSVIGMRLYKMICS